MPVIDNHDNDLTPDEPICNSEFKRELSNGSNTRNLIGFWILGLCNNFAYVIMLSAANDILEPHTKHNNETDLTNSTTMMISDHLDGPRIPICHQIGTGAILLADIIPSFLIKLLGSFSIQSISYRNRVLAVVLFSAISFPVVSFAPSFTFSIIGVAFASLSGGLGELSFMGMLSKYNKNCVSTWSSGTGAAGLLGALSYAVLTSMCHMTPNNTLLLMLVVPVLMFISYFFLLVKPVDTYNQEEEELLVSEQLNPMEHDGLETYEPFQPTLLMKLYHIRYLMKYILPLTIVYFSEYLINQSLFELIYFNVAWITIAEQYRWYQVLYQFGVFLSRSSVNLFKIRNLWILSILQTMNFALLLVHVLHPFLGSVWVAFAIIFYEGLLGGATYVNTFYMIRNEEDKKWKEFSMGTVSISDATGIVIAGVVSVPIHNFLCTL